jgi:hypothetical protein
MRLGSAKLHSPSADGRTKMVLPLFVVVALMLTLVMGITRTRSLDVPLPNNVRLGFFENGWPKRWVCSDGHDHWSFPYWSGAIGFAAVAVVFWSGWRRHRRPV